MFCSKCGNEVANGASFCGKCGSNLGNVSNQYVNSNNINEQAVYSQQIVPGLIFDEAKYQEWLKKDKVILIVSLVYSVCLFLFSLFLFLVMSYASKDGLTFKNALLGIFLAVLVTLITGGFIYAWHRIHLLRKVLMESWFIIDIPFRAGIYGAMMAWGGAFWVIPALIKLIKKEPTRTREEYMKELAKGYI